jgi:uncharacterized protein (TIGR03382 family)
MRFSFTVASLALAALTVTSLPATAVVLAEPDTAYALPGTSLAAQPSLNGGVIDQMSLNAWGIVNIDSFVVREAGTGTLDFYWRVTRLVAEPASGGWSDVDEISLHDLDLAHHDVDWRTDSSSTAPSFARYSQSDGMPGSVNQLFFGLNLHTQGETTVLLLHTNATGYAKKDVLDLLGSTSIGGDNPTEPLGDEGLATFAPAAPVPEPASPALALAGLGLLGWMSRRRR